MTVAAIVGLLWIVGGSHSEPAPLVVLSSEVERSDGAEREPAGHSSDRAEAAPADEAAAEGVEQLQAAHHEWVAGVVGHANYACGAEARVACSGDVCAYTGSMYNPLKAVARRPQMVVEKFLVGALGFSEDFDACLVAQRSLSGPTSEMSSGAGGMPCMSLRRVPVDWPSLTEAQRKATHAERGAACAAAVASVQSAAL